jgi:adenylosuccinate synthase
MLGAGMVIDPEALLGEMEALQRMGIALGAERLRISARAHAILPYHRQIDELREGRYGALGTTRRGIGPAYEDKAARRGIRLCDLMRSKTLATRLAAAAGHAEHVIRGLGGVPRFSLDTLLADVEGQTERLAPHLADCSQELNEYFDRGQAVLFEGAQGVMLDLDHGTYPFVTSSTTLAGGACAGAGVGPDRLGPVIGVSKAYVTRVGEGPMPTELHGPVGRELREKGSEFGATTGRPRRCGWLDLPALRFAVRSAGIRYLALTKLDVLSTVSEPKICASYRLEGRELRYPPLDLEDLCAVEPQYVQFESFAWPDAVAGWADLPREAQVFIELIEREVGVPVALVSVGPGREETIVRTNVWGV